MNAELIVLRECPSVSFQKDAGHANLVGIQWWNVACPLSAFLFPCESV